LRIPTGAIVVVCLTTILASCNDSAPSPTGPPSASFAATNSGKKDRVTGQGVIVATYPFAVSAHGAAGEKANGQLDNSFIIAGRYKVGCLAVSGNRAVVGGLHTTSAPNSDVFLLLEDNGPPGSPVPDTGSELFGGGDANDEMCARILRFSFPLDPQLVIQGDIEITDAAAEAP
jgi:hypothetical protein